MLQPKNTESHWQGVYGASSPESVNWFTPRLEQSLEYIAKLDIPHEAACIDVGGGASSLAGDLLALGYTDVTMLDLSDKAIAAAKLRMGPCSGEVRWVQGDATRLPLPENRYGLWHDRAVLHFLRDDKDKQAYVNTLRRSVMFGGGVVIAAFGPDGPEACCDLPVERYDSSSLTALLGPECILLDSKYVTHVTPQGESQQFLYACFRRV